MAGKGDARRPAAISQAELDLRWAQAFPRGARERKAREIGQLELQLAPNRCMYPGCRQPAGHDMLHNRYEIMREPKSR